MRLLHGKSIIITGASSGIGHAAATLFAEHGAKLVLGARREGKLRELAQEITETGGQARVLAGDVKDETYQRALVTEACDAFGRLDVAFNNAGTLGALKPCAEMALAEWQQVIDTNVTSGFLAAKHQLPELIKSKGAIVFTSSFVGHTVGMPNMAAYAASKAGIIGFTKSLAAEYGSLGVRVNALLPGGTDTDMASEFGDSPETKEFVKNMHALKRTASPEEIAQAALFLASDMASFMTGSVMLVDGGVSINKV